MAASPSEKAMASSRNRGYTTSDTEQDGAWEEVRNQLNQILRGWTAYFSTMGAGRKAYRAVDRLRL